MFEPPAFFLFLFDFLEHSWANNVIAYDRGSRDSLVQNLENQLSSTAVSSSQKISNLPTWLKTENWAISSRLLTGLITDETTAVCDLILGIYRDLGFEDVKIKFADRPAIRVGADEVWDAAEAALLAALEKSGLDYAHNPGEGAFYGPKLEFALRDAIGRDWQCGTHQVDLNLPGRLGASYIGEDGQKHTPVLLHRAIFGSLERFIGILLEHHAGNLPLWLSPTQAKVLTITSDADGYAMDVVSKLRSAGIDAEADLRNEKISYKVREHSVAKVPVLMAVGQREVEEQTVALRRLGSRDQQVVKLDEAIGRLRDEIRLRGRAA